MSTHKMRPALITMIVIATIGTLMITVSPTVRATMRSLFTINDVEVSLDEETDELIAEGNTDAIIYQDEEIVIISEGDVDAPDSFTMIETRILLAGQFSVDEIPTLYPDFVMPTNLPDRYELTPMASKIDEYGLGLSVTWEHPNGEQIIYMWNEVVFPDFTDEQIEALEKKGFEFKMDGTPPRFLETFVQLANDYVMLSDISDEGLNQSMASTDLTFTEEELRAMLPDEGDGNELGGYTIIESRLMLPENFPIEELETLYPEFTMPTNLPDGYELIPVAFKLDEYGMGVGVGWISPDEDQITYMWNESTPVDFSDEELNALEERGYTVERNNPPQFLETFEQLNGVVILSDISDEGINQSLSVTDVSFTEDELRAILP